MDHGFAGRDDCRWGDASRSQERHARLRKRAWTIDQSRRHIRMAANDKRPCHRSDGSRRRRCARGQSNRQSTTKIDPPGCHPQTPPQVEGRCSCQNRRTRSPGPVSKCSVLAECHGGSLGWAGRAVYRMDDAGGQRGLSGRQFGWVVRASRPFSTTEAVVSPASLVRERIFASAGIVARHSAKNRLVIHLSMHHPSKKY